MISELKQVKEYVDIGWRVIVGWKPHVVLAILLEKVQLFLFSIKLIVSFTPYAYNTSISHYSNNGILLQSDFPTQIDSYWSSTELCLTNRCSQCTQPICFRLRNLCVIIGWRVTVGLEQLVNLIMVRFLHILSLVEFESYYLQEQLSNSVYQWCLVQVGK